MPDPTSCTDLNLTGIVVDAQSQTNSDDGTFILTYSGSYGMMNLLDATSRAVLPASCRGFIPAATSTAEQVNRAPVHSLLGKISERFHLEVMELETFSGNSVTCHSNGKSKAFPMSRSFGPCLEMWNGVALATE